MVLQIFGGFNAHHRIYNPKNFAKPGGEISTNNRDMQRITKLTSMMSFNRNAAIAQMVIEEIAQRPTDLTLEMARPTMEEELK